MIQRGIKSRRIKSRPSRDIESSAIKKICLPKALPHQWMKACLGDPTFLVGGLKNLGEGVSSAPSLREYFILVAFRLRDLAMAVGLRDLANVSAPVLVLVALPASSTASLKGSQINSYLCGKTTLMKYKEIFVFEAFFITSSADFFVTKAVSCGG